MSVRITCCTCGHASTSKTVALAEYALSRHSCERTKERQAAIRRARQRAVSGETRECTHPIARHEHGTSTAYVRDLCRCLPCRRANTAHTAQRTKAKAYGRYTALVDAEPVREHIRYLGAHGVGMKQITRLTGVGGGVLTKLVYGHPLPDGTRRPPSRRCTPNVRDRILAVTPAMTAAGSLVDATGTRRRLQALVAIGWSQSELGRQLGMSPSNFSKTIRNRQVVASTARAVAALYDRLWNTPAPADDHRRRISVSRAKRHAAVEGWLPPLAWDDETIDDPDYQPLMSDTVDAELDEIAVERIMAGTLKVAKHTQSPERREAIRRLAARGLSDTEIGNRVGMSGSAVGWTRIRHDIPAGVPSSHVGAA